MNGKEIADTTFTVVRCCFDPACDCVDVATSQKSSKGLQIVILVISFCFGTIDSVTDWIAWESVRNDNYGLLEASDILLYIWLGCTIMGTVLLIVSLITDVIYLCYNIEIAGWNSLTFSEFQSFLNLVLEDLPILTLTCIYVVFRNHCQAYDPSLDAQKTLSSFRELFISGIITYAAIIYRMCRSFYRMCYSSGRCCGYQWCCPDLPESEKLCPKNTCAHFSCIIPYFCFILCQMLFVFLAIGAIVITVITLSGIGVFSGRTDALVSRVTNWNITRSTQVTTGNNVTVFSDPNTTNNNVTVLNGTSNNVTVLSDPDTTSMIVTVLSGTEPLARNGSLFVTEAFHGDMNTTTYCLAYFELQPKKIVFNVAHINKHLSGAQSCICDSDSTPCDRFYENLIIGRVNFRRGTVSNIERSRKGSICLFPAKPLQRDRNLHVNCNCDFSHTVENGS